MAGDKAFGPGIYDMKGGAYIAFHALGRFLKSGKPAPLPVTHLFLSDEEIGSPTSRPLIERLARESKVVLVTEPAREGGKVVTARKGVARYDLETFGVASHAGSRHEDGRNAIAEMCRQILKLEAMTDYQVASPSMSGWWRAAPASTSCRRTAPRASRPACRPWRRPRRCAPRSRG